jgi:hypothetical protein
VVTSGLATVPENGSVKLITEAMRIAGLAEEELVELRKNLGVDVIVVRPAFVHISKESEKRSLGNLFKAKWGFRIALDEVCCFLSYLAKLCLSAGLVGLIYNSLRVLFWILR